ncbi:hypothetical protein Tco_0667769, partial [Tanacetum coccineum]
MLKLGMKAVLGVSRCSKMSVKEGFRQRAETNCPDGDHTITSSNTSSRREVGGSEKLKTKFGDSNPVEGSPAPSPTVASLTPGSTSTQSARGIEGGYKKGYSHSDEIDSIWMVAGS